MFPEPLMRLRVTVHAYNFGIVLHDIHVNKQTLQYALNVFTVKDTLDKSERLL